MHKGIIHHVALARGVACSRAPEHIVAVLTLSYKGASSVVGHADEQVSGGFIALRKRHAIGLGELVQEVADLHSLFQKSA